jgi:hypothetical protein
MTSHDWDGVTRNGWAINALAPIDAAAALAAGGRNGGEAHVPHPDWQAVPRERIVEASTGSPQRSAAAETARTR